MMMMVVVVVMQEWPVWSSEAVAGVISGCGREGWER